MHTGDEYNNKSNGFIKRKRTRKIRVGNVFIGGDAPIAVQSMTNTDTRDARTTINQIRTLEEAGCHIVRVAVPDNEAALAIKEIKRAIKIPLVADIHFDYRLAIASMENGEDKIRINPGNIGDEDRIKQVVKMAYAMDIPIRIGVNSGSVEKHIIEKHGKVNPEGMVESAINHVKILEKYDYDKIAISIKASNVPMTIAAYRLISEIMDYPLHLGVTEAGTAFKGTIKSSAALGCLLSEGIGDTIRVSLTGDPVEEVKVGHEILKALELEDKGVEIVSCPTCGRCNVNLEEIVKKVEDSLKNYNKNIKIAIMGCAVNGPGEAKEADIGIAGGKGEALLFKKGKIIKKIKEDKIAEELIREIMNGD